MKNNIIIFYHYYEKDISYIENYIHFLIFGYSKDVDYLIIIAGEHSIPIIEASNIKYIFTENKNNDYGGYALALTANQIIDHYEYFFFLNSSMRGPFLPNYVTTHWTELFLSKLSPDVGIVGSTINILSTASPHSGTYKEYYGGSSPYTHVQTTCYLIPRNIINLLMENNFYRTDLIYTKDEVIPHYELHLSQLILSKGFNIKCLLPEYNKIDYRERHHDINPTSNGGDPCYYYGYFGRAAHPYETIFTKANRDIFSFDYLNRLALTNLTGKEIPEEIKNHILINNYIEKIKMGNSENRVVMFSPPSKNDKKISIISQIINDQITIS